MKKRKFREPNIKCSGEVCGREEIWVTYTDDIDDLRTKLELLGYGNIRTEFFDFAQWRRQTQLEVLSLSAEISETGRASFKPKLWQRLKRHLVDLFDGNCAYCECRVRQVSYGMVEHYRPKRKPAEAERHPGYFWLAYTPTNLLPCCDVCNGVRAKGSHFPVLGIHASVASEVGNEKPLLLNPYEHEDDPRIHLEFLVPPDERDQLALVRGLSVRGETSVAIYNLRRTDLAQYRRDCQRRFLTDLMYLHLHREFAKRDALIRGVLDGRVECSAACRAVFEVWLAEKESDIANIRRMSS